MQKRQILPMLGFCLLIAAIVLFFLNGKSTVTRSATQDSKTPKPPTSYDSSRNNPTAKSNAATATGESPALNHQALLEEINEAAVTYDAAALPRIQPYLTHSAPEVREAAKNGMIVLGDAAAGPLLREASRHVTTPQEAVALLEAADYVELPSGSVLLKSQAAPNTPRPSGNLPQSPLLPQ